MENFKTFVLGLDYLRETAEAITQRCCVKMVNLGILQNSQESAYGRVSFLIKLQASGLKLYWKETQFFRVNYAKFLTNTFCYRRPPLAAFEIGSLPDCTKMRPFVDLAQESSKLLSAKLWNMRAGSLCQTPPIHLSEP